MSEVVDKADLILRISNGDRQAEVAFVRSYQKGVRALVLRRCRPGDSVVDDLVQDVLTRVLERLRVGAIRDSAALPAYIQATIAYATSAEYRRRRPADLPSALEALSNDESPVENLSSEQMKKLIRNLLRDLPVVRDRELLSRFYIDEQNKDQICRDLDIEDSHFHRVIHRARERFRTILVAAGVASS